MRQIWKERNQRTFEGLELNIERFKSQYAGTRFYCMSLDGVKLGICNSIGSLYP